MLNEKLNSNLIVRTQPHADVANIVLWNDYRVTVLQDRLFRIEHNPERKFRDDATQSVWFRNTPAQSFTVSKTDECRIDTGACTLILRHNRIDCTVLSGGKERRINGVGNLSGTYRTLDGCDGDFCKKDGKEYKIKLGKGVCSRSGVASFDDSQSLTFTEDGVISAERGAGTDEYVFVYGNDYRSAVKALYMITGRVPMVPRFALGNWWSRYHAYSADEYLRLLNRFEERNIPLTVVAVDMDWHYSDHIDDELGITASGKNTEDFGVVGNVGWTGYTWNKNLFPDYKDFLRKIREKNLKVTLNLHPADGIRWWEAQYREMAIATGVDPETSKPVPFDFTAPAFINAYFSILHKPYEQDGVNFWWIDWQQGTTSAIYGLDPLWSLNHYHYLDNMSDHAAPLILSRYAGIGSHRYPLGFSGDTDITWKTLAYLPYFTATASNVGYTWWSHDIGGHYHGATDGELYTRFLQFGVFSPVNRLHCCANPTITKEPWAYKNGTGKIGEDFLRLRHKLIPYIYSADYRTHTEGLALIEPLYYRYDVPAAYVYKNEYFFGEELLVAPITKKRKKDGFARVKVWIPEGTWTDIFTKDRYVVPSGGAEKTLLRTLDEIPVLAKAGTVLPLSADVGNSIKNPVALEIRAFSGNGSYTLYEDGDAIEKNGEFFTEFSMKAEDGKQTLVIVSHGASEVIPKNRKLIVRFVDISDGTVTLTMEGKSHEFRNVSSDCIALEFSFTSGKEYRLEVAYFQPDVLQVLKDRAKAILLQAEGNNAAKMQTLFSLEDTRSEEEYYKTVQNCGLCTAIKDRLTETIICGSNSREV